MGLACLSACVEVRSPVSCFRLMERLIHMGINACSSRRKGRGEGWKQGRMGGKGGDSEGIGGRMRTEGGRK